ncbi:MAG: 30S ribosomal protein S6 [Bacteroidia bacterium]|nr:30S ribosomal protein S6 [Bacteroidia bacterium]
MSHNQYETVIILTPVLSEQQMKDAVTSYRELITGNGGVMVHEENWGLTKLAYPIQKKGTGFYHLFEYQADPGFVKQIELAFRRDERVLRYLTVSLNKHGVIYNDKRRRGEVSTPKPVETPAKPIEKKILAEIEEEGI